MLFAHPNAVDIGMIVREFFTIGKKANMSVLCVEYRGYGPSTFDGVCEASVQEDVYSAYMYAREVLGVPAERLVLAGRSVGSAVVARLAQYLSSPSSCAMPPSPSAAGIPLVILQCPFTSLSSCVESLFSSHVADVAERFGFDGFRVKDMITDVTAPVALHHGHLDTTVPFSHSQELKAMRDQAARPLVTFLYEETLAGHNNLPTAGLLNILQERLVRYPDAPLNLIIPEWTVAQPPLFPTYFSSNSSRVSLDAVVRQWRHGGFSTAYFTSQRHTLPALLTVSVSVFTMRCAVMWNALMTFRRKNQVKYRSSSRTSLFVDYPYDGGLGAAAAGGGGSSSAAPAPTSSHSDDSPSREAFLLSCMARYGSPVGIHLTADGQLMLFGAAVSSSPCASSASSSQSSSSASSSRPSSCSNRESDTHRGGFDLSGWLPNVAAVRCPVVELRCTSELMEAMKPVLSSMPSARCSLPSSTPPLPSVPCFITAPQVTDIQVACEHLVNALSPAEWAAWESILRLLTGSPPGGSLDEELEVDNEDNHFVKRSGDTQNKLDSDDESSAITLLNHLRSPQCQYEWQRATTQGADERMEDVEEWVSQWHASSFHLASQAPWDAYLLRARRLARHEDWSAEWAWEEGRRRIRDDRVLRSVYEGYLRWCRAKAVMAVQNEP